MDSLLNTEKIINADCADCFFYAILQCVGLLCDLKQFRQTKKEMLLQPNKNIHEQVINIVRFHT